MTVDFDPRVSLERDLLGTNDKLRWNTKSLEKTCCSCRPLQAQHFFPVPNARHIHCRTDLFD
jgi:hypothetical protein